jgi:predicted MPP superfamily phosphohydrolase
VLTRRKFVKRASVAAVGSLSFTSAGFASAQSLPGLRRVTLDFPQLPAEWDGLTIAQISDVHAGLYMSVDRMRRIRDLVNRLGADLIVFTGDQIDRRDVDADLFSAGFRGVKAPLGSFGVLGNHDHYLQPQQAEAALSEAGITPLVNRTVLFARNGSRLLIAGVDDLSAPGGRAPDFELLRHRDDAFKICLCHQPQGWHEAREAGADLTLSGHTHGGQIALPTRNLNVARLQTRYVHGPYHHDEARLYVSRGIGVGAVPLRVGAPPELDLISLRRGAGAVSEAA